MDKLEMVIFSVSVLLGAADLLTTIVGVAGRGAVESNPLLAGLTQTNLAAFAVIKGTAVLLFGVMFIGAQKIIGAPGAPVVGKFFVRSASFASCLFMTLVVTNNMIVLLKP